MSNSLPEAEDQLYKRVKGIIEAARGQVARTVNTTMVHAYWFIGREIIEHEQSGAQRADYGKQQVQRLAKRLTAAYGKGFGRSNLWRMRQFYLCFPSGSALLSEQHPKLAAPRRESSPDQKSTDQQLFPPQLSWTHYRILMTVQDDTARRFYEIESARENWASRELERQIGSLLFEPRGVRRAVARAWR